MQGNAGQCRMTTFAWVARKPMVGPARSKTMTRERSWSARDVLRAAYDDEPVVALGCGCEGVLPDDFANKNRLFVAAICEAQSAAGHASGCRHACISAPTRLHTAISASREQGPGSHRNRVLFRVPARVQDLLVEVDIVRVNGRARAVGSLARCARFPVCALVLLRADLLGLECRLVGLQDDVRLCVLVVDVEVVVVRAGKNVPGCRSPKGRESARAQSASTC